MQHKTAFIKIFKIFKKKVANIENTAYYSQLGL